VELKLNEINNLQAKIEGTKDKQSLDAANEAIQLLKTSFHEFLLAHTGDIH
jgi:hypothetical protein